MDRVSPPRWLVLIGGLAGIGGISVVAGLVTARLTAPATFGPLLAGLASAAVAVGFLAWTTPLLQRLAAPSASDQRVDGPPRDNSDRAA